MQLAEHTGHLIVKVRVQIFWKSISVFFLNNFWKGQYLE